MSRATQRLLVVLLLVGSISPGCANMPTAGKVVLTPLTAVRDVIDVPLASLANVFEYWAERANRDPQPNVGVGTGGISAGISLGYYGLKPISWLFGGIDYLVCRSLWPEWPTGISPWKEPDDSVGSIYFPNTKTLWGIEDDSDDSDDSDGEDGEDGTDDDETEGAEAFREPGVS